MHAWQRLLHMLSWDIWAASWQNQQNDCAPSIRPERCRSTVDLRKKKKKKKKKKITKISRIVTKPTKWHVLPAKTQISLGSAVHMNKAIILSYPLSAQRTDQTGRMPRLICLRWPHMPFYWFCHEAAHFVGVLCVPVKSIEPIIY